MNAPLIRHGVRRSYGGWDVSEEKDSGQGGPVANSVDEKPTAGSAQQRPRFRSVILGGLSVLVVVAVDLVLLRHTPSVDGLRERAGRNDKQTVEIGVEFDTDMLTGRRDHS